MLFFFFFFQAEDGIRDKLVTGVQTCALPISARARSTLGSVMGPRRRGRHPAFDARDPLLDARTDAELDLHGFGAIEARSAVRAFLESWRRRKAGAVVHIITGRGKGSANGPVLRGLVKSLLQGELRGMVSEWGLDDGEGGYRVRVR